MVVHNAVDTEKFRPRETGTVRKKLNIATGRSVVLVVANNLSSRRKGTALFWEALQQCNTDRLTVVTVGSNPPQLEPIDGIETKHLGYVSDSEFMGELFALSDVFCVASLDDNFPTTVIEALASGTPVVGFAVGGIPEQVTPACGELVRPGDVQALSQSMNRFLHDGDLRRRASISARKRAESEFSNKEFISKYMQLYLDLLSEPGEV